MPGRRRVSVMVDTLQSQTSPTSNASVALSPGEREDEAQVALVDPLIANAFGYADTSGDGFLIS